MKARPKDALREERSVVMEHVECQRFFPAWIEQSKGPVRLLISDSMELVVREWRHNPAAARSDLIARMEKATAPMTCAPALKQPAPE